MQWKTCMVYGDSEIEDLLDEFCFEDKLWKLEGTPAEVVVMMVVAMVKVVNFESLRNHVEVL